MPSEIVYFVHISDTHIGPTRDFERDGYNALVCAERLVEIINDLPVKPDFVMHTGDVVYNPDPAAYRLAEQLFARLETPVYYVVGNHDRSRDLHHFLPMGPRQHLTDDRDLLTYVFDVKGYRFLVVDARGPDEIAPHGLFSQRQLDLLREEIETGGAPLTIFTHYPVLPLNSIWMDANMLTLNGHVFHNIVKQAGRRLRAVFHGHVHQSMQIRRDGVLYASVASTFSQFAAWPGDLNVNYDSDYPPGYNFVHLVAEQTIIHQHTFVRPGT